MVASTAEDRGRGTRQIGGALTRHIVCLSFDFDAMSGFVARGMTTPTPVSRGEFGAVAADRILALLAKYRLPATWFIPGIVLGTYPDVCKRIAEAGHEIGHHGWTHVTPASLGLAEEEQHLVRGNEAIARLTGRGAQGYRSPAWDLSPHTVELLLKHGFVYDSSMMGHDYLPYYTRIGDQVPPDRPMLFGPPSTLVEMPISWSLDDFPHFEFMYSRNSVLPGLANAGGVLQNWLDDFQYLSRHCEWGVITYTFHPYVIGRGHRMLLLERLILQLIEHGALFETMETAAREFAQRHPVP